VPAQARRRLANPSRRTPTSQRHHHLTPASHAAARDRGGHADARRAQSLLLLQARTRKMGLQSGCTATLPAVAALPCRCVRSLSPGRRRRHNKRASTSLTPWWPDHQVAPITSKSWAAFAF